MFTIAGILGVLKSKIAMVKAGLGITVLLSLIASGWYLNHQKEEAIKDKIVAEQERNTAIENLGRVVEINNHNLVVIKLLEQDKKAQDKAQKDLKNKIAEDQKQIESLLTSISFSDPKDDAPAAPILKKTLESIQKMRDLREKGDESK